MKNRLIIIWFVLGTVFLYSGLSKAINIFSFSQTIRSFSELLGFSMFYKYGVILAILICTVECLMPLLSLRMKYRSYIVWCYPIILSYFTGITYINLTDLYGGIESCGCFGELIHLSPAASFYKSAGLLVLSLLLLFFHIKDSRDRGISLIPAIKPNYFVIIAILTSIVPPLFSYLFMDRMPHVLYVVLFLTITIIGISLCLKFIIHVNARK